MEPKILIVDDEPLVLEMFETVLRDTGYLTTTSSTATEAKNLLLSESFDLIIVDVWLDDEDGFILAQYAKKIQSNIEVVVITGRPSEKGKKDALESDFAYLSKPVPFGDLIIAVEKKVNKEQKVVQAQALTSDVNPLTKLPN